MALDSFNGQVNDKLTSARWKKNPPLLHTLHASHSPAPGQVAKRDVGEPPGRSVASAVGRRMQTQQESETPENIGTPKKQIPPLKFLIKPPGSGENGIFFITMRVPICAGTRDIM